ncbi:MAG: SusC/RagA family TonB-linked outer membrane protein [Dinghuibacter sp.]|nr:SusC/RagA family TonB-linked outer membrane protein [Dinghuibacter sp.]
MTFRKFTQILVLPLLLLAVLPALAQDRTVTGKVTDAKDGSPIGGAAITVKGGTKGVSAGNDGSYSITVGAGVNALRVSAVGYAAQDVNITGRSTADVSLSPVVASDPNEIVVLGYGTARKKDLTGSVTSIKAKDFNKGTQAAPEMLIQGKVAGVQVLSNSGAPGAGNTIRIRGASSIRAGNTPLFVVDGVPLLNTNTRPDIGLTDVGGGSPSGNPLNFINPNDIASMEVLKDASAAAIYGSRGSNGVVIITTKRGQSGAPRVDVNASVGVSNILKRLEVLNGDEYRSALGAYGFPTSLNAPGNATANFGSNVDALDAILRNGLVQNYNVAIGAGNENAKYRLSLGYVNQEGIVAKTGFKKFVAGINTGFKLLNNKKLNLDVNVLTSHTIENVAPISNTAGFKGSLIGQALQWNPTKSLYNADGSLRIEYGSDNINPVAYSEAYNDVPKVTTVLASIAPSYKITNDLEYKTQISVNYSAGVRKQYTTAFININDVAFNSGTGKGGEANVAQNELISSQITNTLSYNKAVSSNLNINAVIGHEYLKSDFRGNSMYARGFQPTDKPYYFYMGSSDPSTRRVNGFADPTVELQSFFGRGIVNYADKYLFTATVRADGSSKFGKNNRYGVFPSFAAAWNISKEEFLSSVDFVKDLKLRAGYGVTGNQEFPAGASLLLYTLSGGNPGTLQQTQDVNNDLRWESTTTINAGVDFTILKGKLSGSIDYFNRRTKDILFPKGAADPLPPNGSTKWENLDAVIVNSGVEFQINGNLLNKNDFNLDFGLNLTLLKNELQDFGANQIPTGEVNGQGLSGAFAQLLVTGQPINTFYLKKFIGIDKTSGISLYEGGEEKFFLGSPNPTKLLGFSLTPSYKKLSLELNFNGAFGHYIYNNTANAVTSFNNLGKRNLGKREYDLGREIGEKPVNPTSASSRYLEKGDYLRLANATLNYRIGNIGKNIRGANVFITGQNLLLFTNFTGFDPEVNVSKPMNNVTSFGMEYTPYPSARTINFGINFSL